MLFSVIFIVKFIFYSYHLLFYHTLLKICFDTESRFPLGHCGHSFWESEHCIISCPIDERSLQRNRKYNYSSTRKTVSHKWQKSWEVGQEKVSRWGTEGRSMDGKGSSSWVKAWAPLLEALSGTLVMCLSRGGGLKTASEDNTLATGRENSHKLSFYHVPLSHESFPLSSWGKDS